VTVGVQRLPEKAPCTPLPEQEFTATTKTESPAASQVNNRKNKAVKIYKTVFYAIFAPHFSKLNKEICQ
jgi:hypothetical protein